VQYNGSGQADHLIASDLPLIGGSRQQTTQMNKAIAYVLDQQGWKAGKYKIAFQSCNDASRQLASGTRRSAARTRMRTQVTAA
jgi:hypothetical protein